MVKIGDKVVCVKEFGGEIILYNTYTISDFYSQNNNFHTYNHIENYNNSKFYRFKEMDLRKGYNIIYFIPLVEFRKNKILKILKR